MPGGHLQVITGKGYDERIQVFDEFGRTVYDGYSDWLVTSEQGPLELRLNFGHGGKGQHFRLLQWGSDALLIPGQDRDQNNGSGRAPWVLPMKTVVRVWAVLGYESAEVESVPTATHSDWLEAWITSSRVALAQRSGPMALRSKIVAEEPDGDPSVAALLNAAAEPTFKITGPVQRRSPDTPTVVAYLDVEGSTKEWVAIGGESRSYLVIGDSWLAPFRIR